MGSTAVTVNDIWVMRLTPLLTSDIGMGGGTGRGFNLHLYVILFRIHVEQESCTGARG